MHTNHRRINRFRSNHHNHARWRFALTFKPFRRIAARERRAEERDLIAHGWYDDLPDRYPRNIGWRWG